MEEKKKRMGSKGKKLKPKLIYVYESDSEDE
jgi:hypothetical protein